MPDGRAVEFQVVAKVLPEDLKSKVIGILA